MRSASGRAWEAIRAWHPPRRDPIKILLIEASTLVRAGLLTILSEYDDLDLTCATDYASAVSRHQDLAPDVVLLNPLGWIDPVRVVREVSSRYSSGRERSARVLLLVGDSVSPPAAAQEIADGLVLDQADPDVLVAAIRLVAAGYAVMVPAKSPAPPTHRPERDDAGRPAVLEVLTQRELDVLRVLAQGATNAEIAGELSLSVSTVKSHVQSLLSKLGLPNRARAVAISHQLGLAGPAPGGLPRM